MGKPPRSTRSRVVPALAGALRAGMLGAGVSLWGVAMLEMARRYGLWLQVGEDRGALFAALVGVAVAQVFGFRTPVASFLALGGRLLGSVVVGVVVMAGLLAALMAVEKDLSVDARVASVALAGLAIVALAALWIHGPRARLALAASLRLRWGAGVGAAAIVAATAWTVSPGLRCSLGSARACRRGAARAADDAHGFALAERGCALEDGASCVLAADFLDTGPSPDRALAAHYFREACLFGDAAGCQKLNVLELVDGCRAQRASACRELAGLSTGADAAWYRRQACLLGDGDDCDTAR